MLKIPLFVTVIPATVNLVGIHDPYASSVGSNNDDIIPGMDHQVMNIGGGQVIMQDVPLLAAVASYIYAEIRAYIEEIFVYRVFADDIDGAAGNIAGDILPGFPIVGGFP